MKQTRCFKLTSKRLLDLDTTKLMQAESVPEVSDKLKPANTADEKFEEVVKSAQDAAVLVLVY